MDRTDFLAVPYDALLYAKGSDEYDNWDENLTKEHMRELERFITVHVGTIGHHEGHPHH